jgi:hypothetical protein
VLTSHLFCLVICGKWESFPREFAKCRRCRKAKYCGKECQSTAWSEGHRFWCSAKDVEEDVSAVGVDHGNSAAAAVGVVGAGDHMQVQVQDQGDHGDLPGIHIAVDTMGDGNVPVTTTTGGTNPTPAATRPERRRHGMGHVVGDGDVSIQRHAAAPGAFGHGLAGPGTTGAARAELSMSRDRTVQPHHHHHHHHHHVATRQRLTIRPPTGTAVSDSSPTTATVNANTFSMLQQQQHLQLQDPMNTSHLSFYIQSTTPSASSSPSSLTTEQRRSREQQQQQQQSRSVISRRRADTVTGVSISSSTSTSSSTPISPSLTPSQRAMVQAQLHLQEVPPNVVMSVTAGVSGHHHNQHHPHHHMLRNRYQTQTQNETQGDSSSSSVVGDWSMGSPVHTPLSSSSSSSSSAAAGASRPEPGPSSSSSSSSRRHHRAVDPTRSALPPAPPLMGTPSSRQKAYQRHGDDGDGDEDECDYEEQEFGDDDMVLG